MLDSVLDLLLVASGVVAVEKQPPFLANPLVGDDPIDSSSLVQG